MISYTHKYIGISREALLKFVAQSMSAERLKHVLSVEETAISLAQQYGANQEAASIVALLHDFAKEMPMAEITAIVKQSSLDEGMLAYGNEICHGPVASVLAEKDFGIMDTDILTAIRNHTIGSPHMSLLGKIIFVADFIEPRRIFPGVEEARKIAKLNLDQAVLFEIKHTLAYLIQKEVKIYPKAIETYNAWVD